MASPQVTARTLRKYKRRRCPTRNPTVQRATLAIGTLRKPRLQRGRHEQRRPPYVQIDRGESFPVSEALSITQAPWELDTNSHALHFTWRSATVNKGCSPNGTHARPTGGENAQESPISSEWRSEAMRHLRRKIWSHPAPLLANCLLFKEVRGSLQGPPGGRPQMVTQASSRLTNSCSENHAKKFPGVQDFETTRLRNELSVQTPPLM